MGMIPFVVTQKSLVRVVGDAGVVFILLIKAGGINLPFGLGDYDASVILALAAGAEPTTDAPSWSRPLQNGWRNDIVFFRKKLSLEVEGTRGGAMQGVRNNREVRELVTRAKGGEAAAFDQLYALYGNPIKHLCCKMLQNEADAEDATQEVFLRLFTKLGQFREEAQFSTWLSRIAINVVKMKWRNRNRRIFLSIDAFSLEMDDDEKIPLEIAVTDHRLALVLDIIVFEEAFSRLTEESRTALCLFMEGNSVVQIAKIFDVSVPAVKSRLLRARKFLQKKMLQR